MFLFLICQILGGVWSWLNGRILDHEISGWKKQVVDLEQLQQIGLRHGKTAAQATILNS